ncbi:hypothetical protein SCHPADRAFT_946399 [Schizopora paradoxa]|uniref:Uncharacterized protein n=1 Tax=Schizopora paradoxa TaxID=27342 RepID=A0A0H2R2T2_9AGAM|nr:hypothetical protein SCHPADRAFT_946399 [Schizopora paradoxa]
MSNFEALRWQMSASPIGYHPSSWSSIGGSLDAQPELLVFLQFLKPSGSRSMIETFSRSSRVAAINAVFVSFCFPRGIHVKRTSPLPRAPSPRPIRYDVYGGSTLSKTCTAPSSRPSSPNWHFIEVDRLEKKIIIGEERCSMDAVRSIPHRLALRNIDSIVKEIEKIRRHHETTINERHYHHASERPRKIDKSSRLDQLSKRLQEYAWSAEPLAKERAIDEALRLSVEDEDLRLVFQSRFFYYSTIQATFGRQHNFFRHDNDKVHDLWSTVLSTCASANSESRYLELNYLKLADSLKHDHHSFIAARYLRHVLDSRLSGNELYFLVKLWHHYLDFALKIARTIAIGQRLKLFQYYIIEWPIFNECLQVLPLGVLKIAFAPARQIGYLALRLINIGSRSLVPNFFSIFYGKPTLALEGLNSGFQPSSEKLSTYRFSFRHLPLYHGALLNSVSDSDPKKVSFGRGKFFEGTVLEASSLWPQYFGVLGVVSKYYGSGILLIGSSLFYLASCKKDNAVRANASAITALNTFFSRSIEELQSNIPDGQALAAFLVESFAAIDLYCQNAVETFNGLAGYVDISPIRLKTIRERIEVPSIPLFDNVPYLRRFTMNGHVYLASDFLPEPPVMVMGGFDVNNDLIVDTMSLGGELVIWLRIYGSLSPFSSGGHYPIHATDDHYVAAVKSQHIYYFTSVEEDASSVTYKDELGEEHSTSDFFVLAQRHEDTKFEWREFWPKRDPSYSAASESARRDDEHLESLLKSLVEFRPQMLECR